MTKLISLFLSFAVLFTTVAPSYGQALDLLRAQKARAVGSEAGLSASLERANYVAYRDAREQGLIESSDWSEVATAAAWIRKYGVQAFRGCVYEGNRAAASKNKQICHGGRCVDLKHYMQACARVGLEELGSGPQGEAVLSAEHTGKLAALIAEYGTLKTDAPAAQRYFRELMGRKEVCGVNWFTSFKQVFSGHDKKLSAADYERRFRQPECVSLTEGLRALSVLDVSREEQNRNAQLIGGFLSTYAWRDYAAVVIANASLALMAMGTKESYAELENFLFSSHAGRRALESVQATVTPSWWVKTASAVGNQTKKNGYGMYHTILTARLSYWDVEKAKEYNPGKDIDIMLQQQDWQQAKYQLPQGNVMEDLGALIAQDPHPLSRELAGKIVRRGLGLEESNRVPAPLVAGVVAGNGGQWRNINTGLMSARRMLEKFYAGDFADLNEGTQRRLHEQMSSAARRSNGVVLSEPEFDQDKFNRYNNQLNFITAAQVGDMAVSAYLTLMLVVSLPAWGLKGLKAVDSLASMRAVVRARGAVANAARGAASAVNKGLARAAEAMPKPAPRQVKPLFNKPYSELNGLQRGVLNLYADAKIAANVAQQVGRGVARHPVGVSAATVTGAPASAYVVVAEQAASAVPVVTRAARTAQALTGAAKTARAVENAASATGVIRAPVQLPVWMAPSVTGAIIGLAPDWRSASSARAGAGIKDHSVNSYRAPKVSPIQQWYAIRQLNQQKMRLNLQISADKLQWQQAGTPIGGQIAPALYNAGKTFSLYALAPLKYFNNPYYKQQQADLKAAREASAQKNAQEIRQAPWRRYVRNGIFDAEALGQALTREFKDRGLVLSANGLGALAQLSGWIHDRRLAKKAARLAELSYRQAEQEAQTKNAVSFGQLFREKLLGNLAGESRLAPYQGRILGLLGLSAGNVQVNMSGGRVDNPVSTNELFSFDSDDQTPLEGFHLAYVNSAAGVEERLPVALSIDPRFKTAGYNRIVFNENFHAELRDGSRKPETMSHFFMKLVGPASDLSRFVGLVKKADLSEPFLIKLQRHPNVALKTITAPLYNVNGTQRLPVNVEIKKSLVPGESRLVLMPGGRVGVLKPFAKEAAPLEGLYVRLPKNQIKNLVSVLKHSSAPFQIAVLPTENKAAIAYRNQQLYNNSLGKTMGPIIHHDLGITAASAASLMMLINYVIPGLASFLNPVLRRIGEKRLSVLAGFMTSVSNFLPPLVGFYGLAQEYETSTIVKGVIVSAFVLRSVASVLQQVTSNMLVAANNGKIKKAAKKLALQHASETKKEEKATWSDVRRRLREVWSQTAADDIRNLLMYNLSFVYKNLGTLLFLALPWVLNKAIYLVSGYEAGLVYSVSFPIFGIYSLFVTIQTLRANLRDAYTVPTVRSSQAAAKNLVRDISVAVQEALQDEKTTPAEMSDFLEIAAKQMRENVNVIMEAQRREKTKKQDLPSLRQQVLAELEKDLTRDLQARLSYEKSQEIMQEFSATLKQLEQHPVTVWQTFRKAPAVALITMGMTLATVHEFTISSAFAMNLNALIPNGDTANLLVATALYLPLLLGRLGGNMIASRISSGSMYLFCTGLSLLGTVIMFLSAGAVAGSITGAVITSLGVGNYFSQMYDYVTKKNPKLQREISVILAITMALAGAMTMPASHLNEWFHAQNLDILYAGAALIASLALTAGMVSNSTIIKFVKGLFQYDGHKDGNGSERNQTPESGPSAGPDMNNPLPN